MSLTSPFRFRSWLVLKKYQSLSRQLRLSSAAATLNRFNYDELVTFEPEPTESCTRHVAAGITQFIGNHRKISATFREKASDFHVHEIDSEGNKVVLTTFGPSKEVETALPKYKPHYVHLTLYKEEYSTMNAVNMIAKELEMHRADIHYAGLKDRMANSSQRISILEGRVNELKGISTKIPSIRLGNMNYSPEKIYLGNSQGNHFNILLKNLHVKNPKGSSPVEAAFEASMKSFKECGFINYYGLQRFGLDATPNFAVGRAVLQRNWEKAFDLLLQPKRSDSFSLTRAKKMWTTHRDPIFILKQIPQLRTLATSNSHLLIGLRYHYQKGKGDLPRVYRALPKYERNLQISAFHSYLWNLMASYRISQFGLKPIVGDFVGVKLDQGSKEMIVENINEEDQDIDENPITIKETAFRVLIQKDIDDGLFSISDVILPQIGSRVSQYPHPMLQEYFEQLLVANDMDLNTYLSFEMEDMKPCTGAFRKLIVKPQNLDYKLVRYDAKEKIDFEKLIPSDIDVIKTLNVGVNARTYLNKPPIVTSMTRPRVNKSTDKFYTLLEFSLPTGSYATMGLREIVDFPEGPTWKEF